MVFADSRDFMAGTGAEGIPYYLYQEAMSQIPDGGSSGGLSFEGGKWGLRFGYWVDGEDAHGHYNEEMKLMMGFSPFRIGWQYRSWSRPNNSSHVVNDWIEKVNTGLGAFDVAAGAKEELIQYAAKSAPAIKSLKYFKAVKGLGKGLYAAQIVISGIETYNAWESNDSNKWGVTAKAGLDIAIGTVGLVTGPIGWLVTGIYFLGDEAGWWGDWGEPSGHSS